MGYSVALLLAFHFIVENIDGVQVSTGELVELNLCDSEKRKEKKQRLICLMEFQRAPKSDVCILLCTRTCTCKKRSQGCRCHRWGMVYCFPMVWHIFTFKATAYAFE